MYFCWYHAITALVSILCANVESQKRMLLGMKTVYPFQCNQGHGVGTALNAQVSVLVIIGPHKSASNIFKRMERKTVLLHHLQCSRKLLKTATTKNQDIRVGVNMLTELATKTLLTTEEVKIWLQHLQHVKERCKEGAKQAKTTKAKKKGSMLYAF